MSEALSYTIRNAEGKESGSIDLDTSVFASKPSKSAVHAVVRLQRATMRSGNHSTLSRSDMKGGGKKPWAQKGSGRARAGSGISPLWAGGAIVFGPKPRNYEFRLNKSTIRQAIVSVLSEKTKNSELFILENIAIESGKSKDAKAFLTKLGLCGKRVVVVADRYEQSFEKTFLSFRNIPTVKVLTPEAVNVYDVLKHDVLLCSKRAIESLTNRCTDKCSASCGCAE